MRAGDLIQKIKTKAHQISGKEGASTTPDGSTTSYPSSLDGADYVDELDDNYGDGEIKILLESLENESEAPLTEQLEKALERSMSQVLDGVHSVLGDNDSTATSTANDSGYSEQTRKSLSLESAYGHPLSVEEAKKRMPPDQDGGLIWHSLLINGDPFEENGKLKEGLNPRDFDAEKKTIKPRRASLPILAKDFYASLTRIEGPKGPRFIFHGVLNGWPSLQTFEVMSIQRKRHKEFVNPVELLKGQRVWAHMWSAEKDGTKGVDPIIKEKGLIFRISFRSPPWSREGWSRESPGFAFWYEAQKSQPTLTYGTNMIQSVDESPKCTNVHMVAHRYAREKENPKDKLTYHTLVLLEWEHKKYCTVIEAAYLNGLAGWRGKSNLFDDLNEPVTEMYKHFPPEMVCPWLTNAAEIRAFDVTSKTLNEFKDYIKKYEGHDKRFVDPQYCFSHSVRLTHRSKKDIAQYLNNYIRRDVSYSELKRNCQTLAADLCAFLAGKREVLPFHPVNRIEYKNRSYLFLYDPEMYDQKKEQSNIQANRVRR